MSSTQVTITQLPQAGPITGTESVPIVQNGQTVQTTTGAIAASPSQTQTFLTLVNEPTLPNSRYLSTDTGLGLTDGGAQSFYRITLNGAAGSLESALNGIVVKTGASTVTNRSVAVSGAGLAITDGDGVAGNPTISLDGLAASLAGMSGTGFVVLLGSTVTPRSLAGTSDQISIANPTGVAGNPTISIANNPSLPGVEGVVVPSGTTGERSGTPTNGTLRYNSTTGTFEGYANGAWGSITTGTGVTSIATGLGLTGGPITSTGTISIDTTVVATLTDTQTLTNKTISGASNTLSNIGNSSLTNSSITVNGVTANLGDSITVTAVANNALTIGTGLTGTSYNGSSAVTIAIDSTVATLTGSQTLTNKTISGSSNTLSNIGNSSLTNSSLTIGTTNIALGATSLTLAGLTSVTVTQDPVSALELATKQYVDTLYTTGIHYHQPVKYEVPNTTGNLNATYNQPGGPGVGVGATLTNAGALVAFAPDGPTASIGDRVLVYNQTNAFENGVYTVTVVGDGSTAWVLTRATDADTYSPTSTTALGAGDAFFVTSGNTGAGETYVCNTVGTITFGTTAISFTQISSAQVYTAGTGLTLTGTQFSLTTPVAVSLGGTGLSSYTTGDIVYASGSTTISKLALGTNGYVLVAGASAPQYVDQSTLSVGSATTATNATNVGVTASTTNSDLFIPLVTGSTSSNYALQVASGPTINPSTGKITAGVSGGTF